MENYETLKGLHLKNASCIIDGISCDGKLFVEGTNIFLLQNKKNGKMQPQNKEYTNYEYSSSWCILKNKKVTRFVESINI